MPTAPDPFDHYLVLVERYLAQQCWDQFPIMAGHKFTVTPLARGEYNLNYLLASGDARFVFRVNMGTQIAQDNQILYEYKALQLLQHSGVTPVPCFVDDSRSRIDRGVSIMEYLPGCPLDYQRDLAGAAKTLATVHQVAVDDAENHLIVEKQPLSLIFAECAGLLETYFNSDLADADIRSFLLEVAAWAETAKLDERYFLADP